MATVSFGQARKDATRMVSFLKSLVEAVEVFDTATAAQDELHNLRKDIAQARSLFSGLQKKVAEEGIKVDTAVTNSVAKIAIATDELATTRERASAEQKRLEAKTAETQASYDLFCRRLGDMSVQLKELHDAQVEKMDRAKVAAQASLAKVEEQRAQMIADLSKKAATDR